MLAVLMGNKGHENDELIANESRILTSSVVANTMDAQKPVLKPSSSKRQGDPMAEIREQHEREFRTRITGPVTSGEIKWEKISKLGTRRTTEPWYKPSDHNPKGLPKRVMEWSHRLPGRLGAYFVVLLLWDGVT
ncbi:hypothetical protein BC629DRAFT_1438071 [Irpex lacteus]|nr:hypothetical protein BC629DRAFT_1438071 [Irpex lacteus]